VREPNMEAMQSQVLQLPRRAPRHRRPRPRPVEAIVPATGRAWINGREVGGTDARFEHLLQVHD
jgi:hypothetical protein